MILNTELYVKFKGLIKNMALMNTIQYNKPYYLSNKKGIVQASISLKQPATAISQCTMFSFWVGILKQCFWQ